MNSKLIKLGEKFPCRENFINQLNELIGKPEESFPNAIFIYGHTGTGKTAITSDFLKACGSKYAILDCIECYTTKIFYETIVNAIYSHKLKAPSFESFAKCDNLKDFLNEIKNVDDSKSYVICLDNAEKLRDMDVNILPTFARLQELTGLNICCLMLSQIPIEKFYTKTGLSEIISICCSQYSKAEVLKILSSDFININRDMEGQLMCRALNKNLDKFEDSNKILPTIELDFYENYLNIFLNVFYKACRDLPELRMISRECFQIYCEPVLNGSIDQKDISKLWRHIAKPLKIALSAIYMRINCSLDSEEISEINQSVQKLAKSLELPYYSKFLLIASYIASHNAAKEDKRLFVKNHGKQRKRLQTITANAKVTEKMSTVLGPKAFTIDRLLAIFYAILDEKVGLTCNLLAQISSLVHLKFLVYVAGEDNVIDGSARLQCTIGFDLVLNISKVVGFNIKQYLCDFM